MEEKIRNEIYKEIAQKHAARNLENATTQAQNVLVVQNNENILVCKRKTADVVGVDDVGINGNLRKKLKAQDCSRVSIRAFLKNK